MLSTVSIFIYLFYKYIVLYLGYLVTSVDNVGNIVRKLFYVSLSDDNTLQIITIIYEFFFGY